MSIKSALRHMARRIKYGSSATSASYIEFLRGQGVFIGEDCTIYHPENSIIDITAPHLITIGDHVNMTGPVTILSHDYSWSVIKGKTGLMPGNQKAVTIGNNVFIGWGATILCGTTIEDNTIIGAHSIVSGHIDGDSVWAGVPAKRICSLSKYLSKRMEAQEEEAVDFALKYKERFGEYPPFEKMYEFFPLFTKDCNMCPKFSSQTTLMGSERQSKTLLQEGIQQIWPDYDAFLEHCQSMSVSTGSKRES